MPGGSATDLLGPRHFDGANYLMGDGHVKFYRPSEVSVGSIAPTSTSAKNTTTKTAEGTEYNGAGAHKVTYSTL